MVIPSGKLAAEFQNELTRFAGSYKWQSELGILLSEALNKGLTSTNQVDQLLMSVTKLVDVSLKNALSQFSGKSVPPMSAMEALESAVKEGFIKSREDSDYHLLKWFFTILRNTSHHEFQNYPLTYVVETFVQTNQCLKQIDDRILGPSAAKVRWGTMAQNAGKVTVAVEEILRANTPVGSDAKLELEVTSPKSRLVKTTPLQRSMGKWLTELDVRGETTGTYTFKIIGTDRGGRFVGSPGTVYPVYGQKCSNCGSSLDWWQSVCPKCSQNQSGGTFSGAFSGAFG